MEKATDTSDNTPNESSVPAGVWRIGSEPDNPEAGKESGCWIWTWTGTPVGLDRERVVEWRWRWIPPGVNVMGARGWNENEEPVHEVEVKQGYWMLETPVTQLQYLALIGNNWPALHGVSVDLGFRCALPALPSPQIHRRPIVESPNPRYFNDRSDWEGLPVENISFYNAEIYCKALDQIAAAHHSSRTFRLPTESEWEYACRAGSLTQYANGDGVTVLDRMGWYKANSGEETHPVGEKDANGWNLFDMHGSVREWCLDNWDFDNAYQKRVLRFGEQPAPADEYFADTDTGDDYRLQRGGYIWFTASVCRSAFRHHWEAGTTYWNQGLRAGGFPGPAIPQQASGDGQNPTREADKADRTGGAQTDAASPEVP